jgi:hypothetical protein
MKKLIVAAAVIAFVGAATISFATHNEPQKAGKYASDLVTAYDQCTFAGANATTSNGFPACTPVSRSASCAFGTKGKGKVQAKTKVDTTGVKGLCMDPADKCKGCDTVSKPCPTGGLAACDTTAVCLDVKVSGLDTATCPAGTVLVSSTVVNATSDDCPGGSCTVTVGPGGSLPLSSGFPTVACTVDTKGNCAVKGTVNGVVAGTLNPAKNLGLEIQGAYLTEGGAPALSAGVLVP